MDKITKEVIDKIEAEYMADKKQSVVAHGLYMISRIRREIAEKENLTKHNPSKPSLTNLGGVK